jgi:hypothetical protein
MKIRHLLGTITATGAIAVVTALGAAGPAQASGGCQTHSPATDAPQTSVGKLHRAVVVSRLECHVPLRERFLAGLRLKAGGRCRRPGPCGPGAGGAQFGV